MRTVKPIQVRRSSDGELHPQPITEYLIAYYDEQYNSPVLLLREQVFEEVPSSVIVTKIMSHSETTLSEVSPTATIPSSSYVVDYTAGIIFLNPSEVPGGVGHTSTVVYKVEYKGLGTLLSTRELVSRDIDTQYTSDSNEGSLLLNFTDTYRLDTSLFTSSATAPTYAPSTTLSVSGYHILLSNNPATTFQIDEKNNTVEASTISTASLPTVSASAYSAQVSDDCSVVADGITVHSIYLNATTNAFVTKTLTVACAEPALSVYPVGTDSIVITYKFKLNSRLFVGYLLTNTHLSIIDQGIIDITAYVTSITNVTAFVTIEGLFTNFTVFEFTPSSSLSYFVISNSSYLYNTPPETPTGTNIVTSATLFKVFYTAPDGTTVSCLSGDSGPTTATLLFTNGGSVIDTLDIPLTKAGEEYVSLDYVDGLYIFNTRYVDSGDAYLTSRIIDAVNISASPIETKNLSEQIGPVSTLNDFAISSYTNGGSYLLLYNNFSDAQLYVANLPKYNVSTTCVKAASIIEWGGEITTNATIGGTGVLLNTTSNCPAIEIPQNTSASITATVVAQNLSDTATFLVNAVARNDSGVVFLVGTPTTTILADTSDGSLFAKAGIAGNNFTITVFGDGTTNAITWDAKGYTSIAPSPVLNSVNLELWKGKIIDDKHYVDDSSTGVVLDLFSDTINDTLSSSETGVISALVTMRDGTQTASFSVKGTVSGSNITSSTIVNYESVPGAFVVRIGKDGNKIVLLAHGIGSVSDPIFITGVGHLLKI